MTDSPFPVNNRPVEQEPDRSVQLLRSGCKVNLYLEIGDKRADGYHNLLSLFYPLPRPFDQLFIAPAEAGCSLTCSRRDLAGADNILLKAYRAFSAATGFHPPLALHLEKNVPVGAGLGGGSANAAVFLNWLNVQAGEKGLAADELAQVALSLGADVPFFLLGRPAWVEGIGQKIFPADIRLRASGLIVHPDIVINTAWAYRELDKVRQEQRADLTTSLSQQYRHKFGNGTWLYNSFEPLVFKAYPELGRVKEALLGFGSDGCVLSGTGASLFSIFSSRYFLRRAAEYLRQSRYSFTIVRLDTGVSPSW